MSSRSFAVAPEIDEYAEAMSSPEHPLLRSLREETASMPEANMQISAMQGRLMAILVGALGVRRYLEIGVFTGYSSLAVALAMPPEGRVVACDVSEQFTGVARRYWREAGVESKIDLRLAPATETLQGLAESEPGSFDLAFIGADKESMAEYFERCLALVRPSGLILLDNTLWSGKVLEREGAEASTQAIQRVNEAVRSDPRVEAVMLPLADGLTVVRRR